MQSVGVACGGKLLARVTAVWLGCAETEAERDLAAEGGELQGEESPSLDGVNGSPVRGKV